MSELQAARAAVERFIPGPRDPFWSGDKIWEPHQDEEPECARIKWASIDICRELLGRSSISATCLCALEQLIPALQVQAEVGISDCYEQRAVIRFLWALEDLVIVMQRCADSAARYRVTDFAGVSPQVHRPKPRRGPHRGA